MTAADVQTLGACPNHPHNHRSEHLVAHIEIVMREAAALVRDDAVVRVLGRVLRQADATPRSS
jgi:hypothetical protein